MQKPHCPFIAIALLGLTGCPLGTPIDHYRSGQDTTIDIAPSDDSIVFNAKGLGGRDLYVLRLSDMSVRRIAETEDYEVTPTFSPDGKRLAYAAGVPGDNADHIFTIRVDGTAKEQLTNAKANDTAPAYSPDGTMIAFARDKTCEYYLWSGLATNWDHGGVICVVTSDGTDERQLSPDEVFAYAPQFSKDGQHVIYSTESGLFSVPVNGDAAATRVGPGGTHVALSADGGMIVFSDGKYSPDHEIFLARLDGTQKKTQITKSEDGCFHPILTSAGDRVYFLMEEWPDGYTGHPKSSIWTVTSQGDDQKQVTDLSLFDKPTTWKLERSP